MTNFQRWSLALICQVYQQEVKNEKTIMRGQRRSVYNAKTNKHLASFEIKEISYNGVDLVEERHKAQFSSFPFVPGDYKFRTKDDYTGDGDYYWIRINNYSLSQSYLEGHHERGYRFTVRQESYDKVRIYDQQTDRDHIYRITS